MPVLRYVLNIYTFGSCRMNLFTDILFGFISQLFLFCLLCVRYPDDLEAFYKSRLPGTWESDRAGKRMKLPTPETWETQVSLKGNKPETWETLIGELIQIFMVVRKKNKQTNRKTTCWYGFLHDRAGVLIL